MKSLFTVLFSITCLVAYGQRDYDTYYVSAGGSKEEHKIQLTEKRGEIDEVFIFSRSADEIYDKSVLIVKAKHVPALVDYLKYVSVKFEEWTGTAISNGVDDFVKDIDADLKDFHAVAFGYDDWHIDRRVKLKSMFSVHNGNSELYVYSGPIYSVSNSYIKSKGLLMPFANSEDLLNLIDKLDLAKMKESLVAKSDTDSLFK